MFVFLYTLRTYIYIWYIYVFGIDVCVCYMHLHFFVLYTYISGRIEQGKGHLHKSPASWLFIQGKQSYRDSIWLSTASHQLYGHWEPMAVILGTFLPRDCSISCVSWNPPSELRSPNSHLSGWENHSSSLWWARPVVVALKSLLKTQTSALPPHTTVHFWRPN